jgi:hypothetical protein
MIFSNSLSYPLRLAYRVILLIFRVYFEKTDLNIKSNSFCCAAKSCLSTRQSTNNFSKEGTQILSIFTMGDSVISFFTMITSLKLPIYLRYISEVGFKKTFLLKPVKVLKTASIESLSTSTTL